MSTLEIKNEANTGSHNQKRYVDNKDFKVHISSNDDMTDIEPLCVFCNSNTMENQEILRNSRECQQEYLASKSCKCNDLAVKNFDSVNVSETCMDYYGQQTKEIPNSQFYNQQLANTSRNFDSPYDGYISNFYNHSSPADTNVGNYDMSEYYIQKKAAQQLKPDKLDLVRNKFYTDASDGHPCLNNISRENKHTSESFSSQQVNTQTEFYVAKSDNQDQQQSYAKATPLRARRQL